MNYPKYEKGELQALHEMLLRTGRDLEAIGYEGGPINESPEELGRISFTLATPWRSPPCCGWT